MLAGVLERCMKRRGVRDSDPYDWEKGAETPQSVTTSSSSTAIPSKAQQRIINTVSNAASENAAEDPLPVSLVLNNQENLHPGDNIVANQQAATDKRLPLQTAQVVVLDKETMDKVISPAAATAAAVPAAAKPSAAQDNSPKKRRLEDAVGNLAPPALQQQQQQDRRRMAEVATPDSQDTESRAAAAKNDLPESRTKDDSAAGFAPLAGSSSMPAVATSEESKISIPTAPLPQSPSAADVIGTHLTAAPVVADKAVRGRTNLRRFHSMNSGAGTSRGVRIARNDCRDRDTSYTQCAVADDDNVSVLQQMTKAGGCGVTMASQWKSQFDDSEETDDELQVEHLQSPEHLPSVARLGLAMMQQQQQQLLLYASSPTSPVHANFPPDVGEQRQESANKDRGAATLPRRSKKSNEKKLELGAEEVPLVVDTHLLKGSTLDGLDVEGAANMEASDGRYGLFYYRLSNASLSGIKPVGFIPGVQKSGEAMLNRVLLILFYFIFFLLFLVVP